MKWDQHPTENSNPKHEYQDSGYARLIAISLQGIILDDVLFTHQKQRPPQHQDTEEAKQANWQTDNRCYKQERPKCQHHTYEHCCRCNDVGLESFAIYFLVQLIRHLVNPRKNVRNSPVRLHVCSPGERRLLAVIDQHLLA